MDAVVALRRSRWSTTRTASVPSTAVGLDETLFARDGPFRRQLWSTQIVDVRRGQLLDVVPGRDSVGAVRLVRRPARGVAGRDRLGDAGSVGVLRSVFDTMLPDAVQVADPFHVVRLANQALDECRRRVQNETLGHRGRKTDPLYRCRRRLVMAGERLSDDGHERWSACSPPATRKGEVRFAWNAKEVVRQIYDHTDPQLAASGSTRSCVTSPTPRCRSRCAGSAAPSAAGATRSSPGTAPTSRNGPTEAVNNLVKRVKRVAFGFRRFRHYRIRSLLYAGKPNWALLNTLTPPEIRSA